MEKKEPIHMVCGLNICREDGVYALPSYSDPHVIGGLYTEALLLGGSYTFCGRGKAIKYAGKFGSLAHINMNCANSYGKPVFYFDKEKEYWHLITTGYVVFLEQEAGGKYEGFHE